MPKEFWKIVGVVTLVMICVILAIVVWQQRSELNDLRVVAGGNQLLVETNITELARLKADLEAAKTDAAPFVATKDAQGKTISVSYQGNTDLAESEVAEAITLSAQTLGANTTGSGSRGLYVDAQSGADIFSHLISLRDNLRSGNSAQIQAVDRVDIQKDEENFLFHYGTNGVMQSRLETSMSVAKQRIESLDQLVSKEADVDLAGVIVKLTQTQNAYKAALQSGGTILNQSLLDYIR